MRRIRWSKVFRLILILILAILILYIGRSWLPGIGKQKVGRIIRPPHEVSTLAAQGSIIYAGGQEGVFIIDRRTGSVKSRLGEGEGFEYVKSLLVDQNDVLWIAHKRGLTSYDGQQFTNFTTKDGLPDNRVNCICQDNQGRLWIGTWGGAAYLENKRWKVIDRREGLLVDMVNVIMEDSRGGMWFGSYAVRRGGVSYYNGSEWSYLTTQNRKLPDPNISDIFEDNNGQILIASGFVDQGGLIKIKLQDKQIKQHSVITRKDGLAGEKVRSIFQEPAGTLWIASEYDGVARISQKGTIDIYTTQNGLSGNEVKDWIRDDTGNLWMATDNGITLIRSDELERLYRAKGAIL